MTLSDFGHPPFALVLPLTMLAPYSVSSLATSTDVLPILTAAQSAASIAAAEAAEAAALAAADDTSSDEEGGPGFDLESESVLTPDEVANIRAARASAAASMTSSSFLDAVPDQIGKKFSSVLGDVFHFMDRPKVPIHHEAKKSYFVALRDAWYIFNPSEMSLVEDSLRGSGMSDAAIESKKYHDFPYFRLRVQRFVPPPPTHHTKVRAVFDLFGRMVDSKSGKPLFNKAAWVKANNVLQEILAGNAADPPGVSFYKHKLDAKGLKMSDKFGIPLLECNRGTNDTENCHKHYITTWGTWCTGVEMSDVLLAERRHRGNQNASERRRLGFPRLGHFDTWKVDALQLLVERNHGILLHPGWSNTNDYRPTSECFGTVRIHTPSLGAAIDNIILPEGSKPHLTGDMKYLCRQMGTRFPLLPVHGEVERKLFERLVRNEPSIDFDRMAVS